MDDGLSCSICMNRFNESRHSPLILGCGHTFCKDCLTALSGAKRQLKCPNCSRIESTHVEDLPRNYVLGEILLVATTSTSGDTENPLSCKLHPSEQITFVSKSSRQPFCHECIVSFPCEDLVPLDPASITKHMQRFKQLYETVSTADLENRSDLISTLGEALQGHKLRVMRELEDAHLQAMANFQKQFVKYHRQVKETFDAEQEKLTELARVLRFLKDMKSVGVKFDSIGSHMNLAKSVQLAPAIPHLAEVGITTKLKDISTKTFNYKAVTELKQSNFNVPLAIVECPMKLIEGGSYAKDTQEKKLSRFATPTNRWGIFEGRNQVEAVTFTVNQRISINAIGLGCAFHENKAVSCEVLQITDGPATNSPVLREVKGTVLPNTPERSVKIPFSTPVELSPNRDYTIRAVIRGDAGVYRGGSTSRTKTTPQGVTFKFKTSNYGSEDVKNGDNADDGPILDIYYCMAVGVGEDSDIVLARFGALESSWIVRTTQVDAITFEFSRQVTLTAVGIGASTTASMPANLSALKILKGHTTRSPVISEVNGPQEILPIEGAQFGKVVLNPPVKLDANTKYTARIQFHTATPVYRGTSPFPIITAQGITMKTEPVVFEGGDMAYNDNSRDGPIVAMFVAAPQTDVFCSVSTIPTNFLQQLGGICKLSRFETYEKHWHFNNEKQVESFSFIFNKPVLLTGLGLGNTITSGTSYTLKSVKVIAGNCTIGPEMYRSTKSVKITNQDDTNPIVKVDLETPVRIEAEGTYTIRVVMRGDVKAYKGKTFKGATLTGYGGVTFRSFKSNLGGEDKRNGDNETGGPIFDFYYLPLEAAVGLEEFRKAAGAVIPLTKAEQPIEITGVEHCYKRFSSVGNGWHINTDGKQIEAITFKVSKACSISAVGIGNAHEETKKVIVSSLAFIEGKSTKGPRLYKHPIKEKLMNVGVESRFVKVQFTTPIKLVPEQPYTLRAKYKPGSSIVRGTTPLNSGSFEGINIVFEKSTFEGGDVENGSHETHGPLRDFYFLV